MKDLYNTFKKGAVGFVIILSIFSHSITIIALDTQNDEFHPGCSYRDGEIFCESTGIRSEGHYVFAGGSACCGCQIRHYGVLPDGFPNVTVKTVTFYLTTSRNNSYYTTIKNGPNDLKLILGDGEDIATSISLESSSTDPVEHSWYLQFEFNPSVSIGEGTSWQLVDGDNNIYSAVWLHASDVDQSGLPGTYENSNCQYAETRTHWYSVKFEIDEETEPEEEEPDTKVIEVDSCIEINEPGYYRLTKDIYDCSSGLISITYSLGACIYIKADNVTFDGNNHIIDGTGGYNIGIRISGKNVTVKNVILQDWGDGIQPGSKGKIENNTITSNVNGIVPMDQTENCTITGNKIYNNSKYGVCFARTKNNVFTNNNLTNNNIGIYLLQSNGNIFYNNLFNNTKNVELEKSQNNIWNTDKEQKTNIINGQYIGGNAWYHPSGYGFSQTSPDENDDRLCDDAYEIDSNNNDNYPLASPRPDMVIQGITIDNPLSYWGYPGFFRIYTFKENNVDITVTVKNSGDAHGKAIVRLEELPDEIGKQIRLIDVPKDETVTTTFNFNISDYDELDGWIEYGFNTSGDYTFTVNVTDIFGNITYDLKTDKITVKLGPKIEVYVDRNYDSDNDMKIEMGEYFLLDFYIYNGGDEDVSWIDLYSDLRYDGFIGHDIYNVKTDGLIANDVWSFDNQYAYLHSGFQYEDMSQYTKSEVAEKFQWQPTAVGVGRLNFDIEYHIGNHKYWTVGNQSANFSIYDYSGKTLTSPQVTKGRDFEVTVMGISGSDVIAKIKNTGGVYYTYKINNVPTCLSTPCTDELLSFLAPGGKIEKTITTKGVATSYKFKVQYDYSSVLNTIDGLLNAVSPILPSPLDNVPLLIDIVLISAQGNIDEKKLAEMGVSYLLDELTDPASKYHKAIINKVTQKYGSKIAGELATELAGGAIVELPMALYKGFEWAWNNIKADPYHAFEVTIVDPPLVYTVNSTRIPDSLYFGSLSDIISDDGTGSIQLIFDKNGKGTYSSTYFIDTLDTSLSDMDFSKLSKLIVKETGMKIGNDLDGDVIIEIYLTDNVSSDAYALLLADVGFSESLLHSYFENLTSYTSKIKDDHIELYGKGILRASSFHDEINNTLVITADNITASFYSYGKYAEKIENQLTTNLSFGPRINVPLKNTKLEIFPPTGSTSISPKPDQKDGTYIWDQTPSHIILSVKVESQTPGFPLLLIIISVLIVALILWNRKK